MNYQQTPHQLMQDAIAAFAMVKSPALDEKEQGLYAHLLFKIHASKLRVAKITPEHALRALPLMGASKEITDQIVNALAAQ